MKRKALILVVEDKSLIYKRLKLVLEEHNYSVSAYVPSVADAIGEINKKRPDLALLDIDLQGEHNGIYLGQLLATEYNIPFIYVTDFDDDQTFYEGLQTKHADFIPKKDINLNNVNSSSPMVINTKPHLDEKRLVRAIQTVLKQRQNARIPYIVKDNVIAYVDYVEKAKALPKDEIQQKTVELKNVAYFTRNSTEVDEALSLGKDYKEFKKIKSNYVRLLDWQKQSLYIPCNLKAIVPHLPYYFVQISDHMVINIHPDELKGSINGSFFKLSDEEKYKISDTFKTEVKKRMSHYYLTPEQIKKE